jgi:hypothetical protein
MATSKKRHTRATDRFLIDAKMRLQTPTDLGYFVKSDDETEPEFGV